MEKAYKFINKNKTALYGVAILMFTALFWLIQLLSGGKYIDTYYLKDNKDSYMDYFNVLAFSRNDPYLYTTTNYPALCFVLLRIIINLLPNDLQTMTSFMMRDRMEAQLTLIFLYLICILLISKIICDILSNNGEEHNRILTFALMTAGPVTFTLERGNIILISFLFVLIFFKYYKSNSFKSRLFAYIALSIATGIKIYPALYGLMLIENWKNKKKYIKEIIIFVLIEVVVFFLPFYYYSGIDSFIKMLNGIIKAGEAQNSSLFGFGINYSLENLIKIIYAIWGYYIDEVPLIIKFIFVIIFLMLFLINQEQWSKSYCLTIIMILFPSFSYTYVLDFLIIPFILLLEKQTFRKIDYIYATLIMTTQILMVTKWINILPNIEVSQLRYPLYWNTIIVYISIITTTIIMTIDSVMRFTRIYKRTNC